MNKKVVENEVHVGEKRQLYSSEYCEQFNKVIEARREKAFMDSVQHTAEDELRRIKKLDRVKANREKQWKSYRNDTVWFIMARSLLALLTLLGMCMNRIDVIIAIALTAFCVLTICVRLGCWYEVYCRHKAG